MTEQANAPPINNPTRPGHEGHHRQSSHNGRDPKILGIETVVSAVVGHIFTYQPWAEPEILPVKSSIVEFGFSRLTNAYMGWAVVRP